MNRLNHVTSAIKEWVLPFNSRENLIILSIIVGVVFFAYSPLLHFNYIFHDDYYFFSVWTKENCYGYGQFWAYLNSYARPIGGTIKCLYGMSFDSLLGAKYVRAFNILLLSMYILLVAVYISRISHSKWLGVLLALPIAFITSYQTPMAQISNAHHIFAAIFALLGLGMAIRYRLDLRYFSLWNLWVQVVASILLAISVFIYQPATMLFWVFLAPFIIVSIQTLSIKTIKRLIYIALPCCYAMVGSLVYIKVHGAARGELAADVSEKITWAHNVVPLLLSYGDVSSNNGWTYATLALLVLAPLICVATLLLSKEHPNTQKALSLYAAKLIAYCGLFILSIFPLIATKEMVLIHRALIAPKTLIVILVLYALYYIVGIICRKSTIRNTVFGVLMVPFIVFGAIKTQSNMLHYYAVPASLEYSFLSRKVNAIDFSQEKHYHVIKPHLPFLSKERYIDEFGTPTTIFPDDVFYMIVLIARENHLNVSAEDILSGKNFSWGDGTIIERPTNLTGNSVPNDSIFIHMNDIRGITFSKEPE